MVEAASGVVESVSFGFLSSEEIRRISVKAIVRPETNDVRGIPVPDGLCDPALGPINDKDSCKSCGLLSFGCPGHCGHIDLALSTYNPLLFGTLRNLLKMTCFSCHRFRMKAAKIRYYVAKLNLIRKGDIAGARNLRQPSSLFSKGNNEDGDDLYASDSVEVESMYNDNESFVSWDDMETSDSLEDGSKKQTWTSVQQTEATSVLVDIMHETHKECENCAFTNPRISSPVHGSIELAMRDADVRANVISRMNAASVSDEAGKNSIIDGDASNDDGLLSEMETGFSPDMSKSTEVKWKNLPPDFIKQKNLLSRQLLPSKAKLILQNLWRKAGRLCKLICDIQQKNLCISTEKDYNIFFMDVILVPPNKFRPTQKGTERDRSLQHPQNILLTQVVECNISLRDAIVKNAESSVVFRKWKDLQRSVNVLMDSSKGFGTEKEATGLRQVLEKKAGILRQKMMGKRVNFACRSVISPDPFLAVNEIGIPPHFAMTLTYPERVTPWNANKLRHAVINGGDIHPGATHFKDKERLYRLNIPRNARLSISRKLSTSQSSHICTGKGPESDFEGKVVHRHLRNGDVVLVNRQPTLHKLSIKGHVARVLEGERTLRFHYTNCNSYNADFDGDEMNVHLPQDEISRAEGVNIVNANRQYTQPTSGKPDRGLIQDHIVSAVLLTKIDTFLTRDEYHQLLYSSCIPAISSGVSPTPGKKVLVSYYDPGIQPLSPAIWKPVPLWTGKQVISAILNYVTRDCLPCTVQKTAKTSADYLGGNNETFKSKEHKVLIAKNEFLHGIIDKEQFGSFGLVHTVNELYGSEAAGVLLSSLSRLFTVFLQMHGFTCGLDDLLIVPESEARRQKELEKSDEKSREAHCSFLGIEPSDDQDQQDLQMKVENVSRENGESATAILDRKMSNAMNDLTSTITKQLIPNGLRKPFVRNCVTLMTTTGAKGSLVNFTQISSLLGQQQLEGKRVPSMVSGKTLPCFPPYDTAPRAGGFISDRFLTGLRPQEYYFHCMAGREGLVDTAVKTSRSGYLQRCLVKNLESLKVCYDHTVRDADGSIVQFLYGEDGIDGHQTGFLRQFKSVDANHEVICDRLSSQGLQKVSTSNSYFKGLPEKIKHGVEEYIHKMSKKHQKKKYLHQMCKKGDLFRLMELKYLNSLCSPGEAVGVLAAQSVGEPSTQMTLNTFHLAGRGEVNVTLGIPRLQEIFMNAKQKIKTPIMTCPLREGLMEKDANMLSEKLRRVSVADIVESMEVCVVPLVVSPKGASTTYKLKIKIYDPKLFPPQIDLRLEDCMAILESDFVTAMDLAIKRHMGALTRFRDIQVGSQVARDSSNEENVEDETGGESDKRTDDDEDDLGDADGDENVEDQGADAEKRKMQGRDEMEYDDDEGEEKQKETVLSSHALSLEASGSESEIDQVESDEDQAMEEDSPDTQTDAKAQEKPAALEDDSGILMGEQPSEGEEKKAALKKKKRDRVIYVKSKGRELEIHFKSKNEPHMLLAEIAQKTAKNVFLKQADNIERCTVLSGRDDRKREVWMLQTAGVDFRLFWELEEYLDINRISSNNIYDILNTYGVEAARATIIREVNSLFQVYGVSVDMRHLNLIADFMTVGGDYRPMNRHGVTEYSTSAFGKITFETATKFIIDAALHGEVDTLEGPSSSICLGQPVKLGTGLFDVMQNA